MLRLLMLEDDALAAELTLRTLESAGLPCICDRVVTEVEFRAALARSPDLVLSDSNVPGLDGMTALAIAKAERPKTPFIFVSGNLDDRKKGRAREHGAGCLDKSEIAQLPELIRTTLDHTVPRRRRIDGARSGAPGVAVADTAQLLLQRQATLEQVLKHREPSALSSLLSRAPPTPAALVMIESVLTQERYLKLLRTADIAVEVTDDAHEALRRLAEDTHALLFTDRLDLIREARQLPAASAIHMVFIADIVDGYISEGLRAGANDVVPAEGRGEQFWAHLTIARHIVSFAASLQSAITDNRLLSTIDALTRVGNRRYFEHQWPREVARAVRFSRSLSLLMCDIDHFKSINDQYGHQVGDAVLREFGERLTSGLRLGEDWVARVGGEEFGVVLPETGRSQARAIAERLREGINAAKFLSGELALSVTASFGFCTVESTTQRTPELSERMLRLADGALYDSKRAGRNRVSEALLA